MITQVCLAVLLFLTSAWWFVRSVLKMRNPELHGFTSEKDVEVSLALFVLCTAALVWSFATGGIA